MKLIGVTKYLSMEDSTYEVDIRFNNDEIKILSEFLWETSMLINHPVYKIRDTISSIDSLIDNDALVPLKEKD